MTGGNPAQLDGNLKAFFLDPAPQAVET